MQNDTRKLIESLSREKRALLERRLLERRGDGGTAVHDMSSLDDGDRAPLSSSQQRLWLIDQLGEARSTYNIPYAYRVDGPLDIRILERCFNRIIHRHEALRTNFVLGDDEPCQVVVDDRRISIEVTDLAMHPASERERLATVLVHEEIDRVFDLSRDPLLRVRALRLSSEEHVLIMIVHHIVMDGWSMSVLFRELRTLYDEFSAGKDAELAVLPVRYSDYARWQQKRLQENGFRSDLDFWLKKLERLKAARLPAEPSDAGHPSLRGAEKGFVIPDGIRTAAERLGRAEGGSLFMVLLAAMKVLIHRYSDSSDVAVATPVTGRVRSELVDVVGYFVNTIILRTDTGGGIDFRELIRRVKDTLLESEAHQELPYDRIVEELRRIGDPDDTAADPVQMMFSMRIRSTRLIEIPGCVVDFFPIGRHTTKFDLTLTIDECVNELKGRFRYDTDRFSPEMMDRLAEHYLLILDTLVSSPDLAIDRFPLARTEEAGRVASSQEDTEPPAATVHKRIERQSRAPERPVTETEKMLADVWTSLLGIPDVHRNANFFDVGGHSLLAIRIITETKRRVGVEIPLRTVFDSPTLAEMARAIDHAAGNRDVRPEATSGRKTANTGTFPLSFAQRRMWFIDRLESSTFAYNVPSFRRIRGPLDVPALERSLNDIIARHEILRTTFELEGDRPVQIVAPELYVHVPVSDLEQLSPEAREERVGKSITDELHHAFDLSVGPLIRASILRISETEHVLLLNLHHIVTDEWSLNVMFRELGPLYEAHRIGKDVSLPELPLQYGDFAVLQNEQMEEGRFEEQLTYWRSRLAGYTPAELPVDRRRKNRPTFKGSSHVFELPASARDSVRRFGRDERSSLFMVLLTALYVLVHRYTGADDIAIGAPVAGRNRSELRNLIGFFVNTLVLRTDMSGRPSFRELLGRVRETVLDAESNQDLPYDKLIEELRPDREGGRPKLFQIMFSYRRAGEIAIDLPGLCLERLSVDRDTAKFDLGVSLIETDDGLRGSFQYDTDLFEADTIRRMSGDYVRILAALFDDPDVPVKDIPLVDEETARRRTASPNPVEPPSVRVHEQIELQAKDRPDASAVVHGDLEISFGDLNRRANRIARRLRELGVRRETLVGICLDRSPDLIVSLLAVLKSGGAYLPMDPEYPDARLGYMLEDASPAVLVTENRYRKRFAGFDGHLFCVDGERAALGKQDNTDPEIDVDPRDLAYVIYTSGSTGSPKGVMIEHGSLEHLVASSIPDLDLKPDDRVLQFASISFDVAVQEIFETLVAGATVVLRTPDMLDHTAAFFRACRERKLTVLHLPTAFWHELVNAMTAEGLEIPASVRLVEIGGERARSDIWAAWHRHVGASVRLLNAYGPTEATVTATVCDLTHREPDPEREVPIGRPYAHIQAHVLDSQGHPVPVGVPGELVLGGTGIARGYLNRPDLTEERFVPDLFSERAGARLYRTGDIVRYRNDGQLEFIGRVDRQVKIRGYRIEPGEIEAVLNGFVNVADAVVEVGPDAAGRNRLDAYVVLHGGRATLDTVRDHLRQKLPGYMVPSTFTVLDSLPRTPNEKIDRSALPAPESTSDADAAHEAPSSPTERTLAEIWASLLGVDRIGRRDNFFDLGGHSLLAIQIVSETRRRLGADIALRTIFDAPTIAELAAEVDRRPSTSPVAPPPALEPESTTAPAISENRIERVRRDGTLPLSFAQRRLWFIEQLDNVGPTYNVPSVYRLHGPLDIGAFERSLDDIVRRHEILRTTFRLEDNRPVQVVARDLRIPVDVRDLSVFTESERDERIREIVAEETERPFDLTEGPLIRSTILRVGPEDHVLILNLHHIATDNWSTGVLFAELRQLYAAHLEGAWPSLSPLPVQYGDYAAWQREQMQSGRLKQELEYWRARLDGLSLAELPMDRARPAAPSFRGSGHPFRLEGPVVERIRALCGEERASTFMVILGVLEVLIHRYTDSTDIVVGAPVAGRNLEQLEDLIGFFVNTLVLRTDASGDPSFRDLLTRTRETVLQAEANQNLPFDKLVEELRPDRDRGQPRLFQVMFSYSKAGSGKFELPGLTVKGVPTEHRTAKFDLTVFASESERAITGAFQYDTELFDSETIRLMTERFRVLVGSAVRNPDMPISELPLIAENERHRLLSEWRGHRTEYPRSAAVHELFEERARSNPEAPAVISDEGIVSYARLNAGANELAARILTAAGRPVSRVGLYMNRSSGAVKAMLAVLKAGGAYVPLDPSYPATRLGFMIEDAGIDVLLASQPLPADVQVPDGVVVLDPEADGDQPVTQTGRIASPATSAADPAYIIYTSGSTGTPKGVVVPHRAIVRLVRNTDYIELGPNDRIGHASNISFDAATFEVWGALLNGAPLVVLDRETILSPDRLADAIRTERINTLFLATALFNTISQTAPDAFATLRHLLIGGESAAPGRVRAVLQHGPPERLLNVYGPTENTTFTTWHLVKRVDEDAAQVPIGRPVANTEVFVLDRQMNPVPPGVPGELFIGGDGLADGYLDRPELTEQTFIEDPIHPGSGRRLYRSGDIVRWTPDGVLEFIGRTDRQVKIRGFRIELKEIESVLESHPEIGACSVRVEDSDFVGKHVAAYVVPRPDASPSTDDVIGFLRSRLPGYMVPGVVAWLDELPLTPNGKVDQEALAGKARVERDLGGGAAPVTRTQKRLRDLWCALLERDDIGIRDDFFDAGGHSLLAVELFAAIERTFRRHLSVSTIFSAPTIEQLADIIDHRLEEQAAHSSLVPMRARGARTPLFCTHGVSSDLLAFKPLTDLLAEDRPIFGLQGEGLDGEAIEYRSVEEMAGRYADDICSAYPSGPVYLMGFCYGGLVAFEVAHQLLKREREIGLLILIDAVNPLYRKQSSTSSPLRRYARRIREAGSTSPTSLVKRVVNHLRYRFSQGKRRIVRLIAKTCVALHRPVPSNIRLEYIIYCNHKIIGSYTPRRYPGPITLIRSSESTRLRDDFGWADIVDGAVDVHTVEGSHQLLRPPYVRKLAECLQVQLDEAE